MVGVCSSFKRDITLRTRYTATSFYTFIFCFSINPGFLKQNNPAFWACLCCNPGWNYFWWWPEKYNLLQDEGRGYFSLIQIDNKRIGVLFEGSQADMVFEKAGLSEIFS